MSKLFKLFISIGVCFAAGAVGMVFTVSGITSWYPTLAKPVFNPPNWIFGPVWTILYILMAISLYRVWTKNTKNKKIQNALKIFGIHLFVNALWSPIFFGLHDLFLALAVIILLWYMILITIRTFAKIDKIASYLLWPYFIWVSFATILNFSIWLLNR